MMPRDLDGPVHGAATGATVDGRQGAELSLHGGLRDWRTEKNTHSTQTGQSESEWSTSQEVR